MLYFILIINFFVDCSIIDTKLFFATPTLWYLMFSERYSSPILGTVFQVLHWNFILINKVEGSPKY